jgi:CDP-diacylglycerol--glycerol-3-phosphate 3-phosphatidyltransferase
LLGEANMTDLGFACLTAGVWVVLLVAYGARVLRYGAYHSARVAGVGGTVLIGENLMQATYWAIDPVVRGLVRLGATANLVTYAAVVLGIGAGISVACGWFGLACLLATLSTISDILDGQVARIANTGSRSGEVLDSIADRYTEFAFVAGFIVYAHESVPMLVVALAALLACFMSSYTTAKAEAMRIAVPRGLMRRHERAVFMISAAAFTPAIGPMLHDAWPVLPEHAVFAAGLAFVALVGNYAALKRQRQLIRAIESGRTPDLNGRA